MNISEERLYYPHEWEAEYKSSGVVQLWLNERYSLFERNLSEPNHPGRLSARLGTLDLFAQYALQYLLWRDQGFNSVTWYKLASKKPTAKTQMCWDDLRSVMGPEFDALREALLLGGFSGFTGEPDLFCWSEGSWFFAEAKRKDKLGPKALEWMKTCNTTLGDKGVVQIYRLIAKH